MFQHFSWVLVVYLFFLATHTSDSQWSVEYMESLPKQKIYLHSYTLGQGVDTSFVKPAKLYLALNFIVTELSSGYELISPKSVAATISDEMSLSPIEIGAALDADLIFIIKMEQLWNAVRIEIISASPQNPDKVTTEDGYAMINIFKRQNDEPIIDPTILTSMQRAFASTVKQPNMFMHLEPPYNIKPAPCLVLSNIEFIPDDNIVKWSVFDNPEISSYEYLELIYENIYHNRDWVVYDLSSRDAIYSMYNLALVENHLPPSNTDLAALYNFGIDYYLSGSIRQTENGITITLSLNNNVLSLRDTENKNIIIRSVSSDLINNDYPVIKKTIADLSKKLIFQQ